ncbi:MAG: peptide deformylase [Deltaproteobacteria bacterium]|nr:peptide deformylase [Deltaproteobacteria bacterium]
MAVLEIVTYPNPVLTRRAEEVEKVDGKIRKLISDMVDTMYANEGIGLAAPQVGVPKRVFVVDVRLYEPSSSLISIVNPEVVAEGEEVIHEEGCLSVPECVDGIKRKTWIKVRGLNERGREIEVEGEGMLAIALQHEIDHLNGKVILDRMSRVKRDLYKKRLQKAKDRA